MEGGGQIHSEESSRMQGETVRSRWTPKPEQILILESIFNSGMVNPPKDETVRIRKLLQRFGPVADANVFYWFQNRRSRSRRRQRQLQQAQQAQQQAQAQQSPAALSPAPAMAAAHMGGYSSSSSSSSTWPPSSPPSAGIMMDGGGGDDLFAISRQMGYGSGSSSSSSAPAAAAMAHEHQQQMYYSYQQQQQAAGGMMMSSSTMTVYINGVATEVPARGPVDVRAMFGDDAVLVHAAGGLLPVDDYGVLLHSLQMGESYFLVSRSA